MNHHSMIRRISRWALLLTALHQAHAADPAAVFRLEVDPVHARVPVLSWDTEGGDRAKMNLLRTDTAVGLRIKMNGQWRGGETFATRVEKAGGAETCYRLALAPDAELEWRLQPGAGRLTMTFAAHGAGLSRVEGLELEFPFDPRVAATTLLPQVWDDEGKLHLPAIISAPDFGQMLLQATPQADLKGRLIGSRANHTVDFTLELPVPQPDATISLTLEPVRLPTPAGLQDQSLWHAARRGWFNAFEPSAQWGDWGYGDRTFGAPAGILANNVVSDPTSCMIYSWGDQALLTPPLPAGISMPGLVRRTVDWWLDHRTKPTGEVTSYWDYADMLDTSASPLIAAWDYVEATGDRAWLARRIERLEFIAQYLVKRDVDNDGLVESTHSGNYGTLIEPMRGDSTYDTINAGHKNAYCNALIYRAFRCLADLERQLQRPEQQQQYTERADRLKAAYVKTFFNPATGWLAWWKSEDGEVHDLSSPTISSLAICYGLVEPSAGRQMLDRLWTKMEAAGFKRFDLGVPVTLVPIRRGDYLIGLEGPGTGVPKKEDGSDTFGQYLNGGVMVSDALYFITALHITGEHARGDRILRAMVERQERGVFPNGGGFQNGVVNEGPRGAEFYTWDGQTTGYEGHLSHNFAFLQAVFLREPAFRARLYRPLQ
ncbi:MAG: hypothetical protein PHE83_14625 [Opitutaceae bacterium]|nr:hypothetical protein [Opitutaceae bacterium]